MVLTVRVRRAPLLIALAGVSVCRAQSSSAIPPNNTISSNTTISSNITITPNTTLTETNQTIPVTYVSLIPSQNLATVPSKPLNWTDPCAALPLEPATWDHLNLDNYLAKYPKGDVYTLGDFALSNGIQNWVCGIGEYCDAQQKCNPILGPQWEVFYAIQNWNNVQNTIYSAISLASSMTQSIVASLVNDLYHPAKRSPLWKWNDIFSIAGGIAALVASVVMIWPGTLLAIGVWYAINSVLATGEGAVGIMLLDKDKKDEPDPFQRWSEFSWYLGKWQSLAQGALTNKTMSVINSGISTPQGISGVLKNGSYLRHLEPRQFQVVESEIKFAATARILTAIIRDYGGFVTVGEGCHGKGPNGAWEDPNSISFCYSNKTMMNVIRHKKDEVINNWYHGSVINSSYGFTAEYLTTQSYNCQMKYGGFEHNPYNETAVPTDKNADCVVNLPVCDLRIPAVHHAVKKHGTVKGCRDAAKLPI